MSRPSRRSGSYGLMPAIGWVVDFWKYSGTISTSPPTATTRMVRTISRSGRFSILSWVNAICSSPSGVSRVDRRDRRVDGLVAGDGLDHVDQHQQHPPQVQHP